VKRAAIGNKKGAIQRKEFHVALVIVAALLVLLFFGLGFAIHFLWFVAVVFFILWLVGFAVGRGETAGRRGWYGR
jgi:uncharacterized membrane protein YhaH (DUF805 family)